VVVVVGGGCVEGGTVLSVVGTSTVVDGAGGTLVADASGSVINGDEAWSPPQLATTRSATVAAALNRRWITTHLHSHHAIDVSLDR
jgi:hypothetical protein